MESKESHNPVKTQAFRLMERCRGGCSRYRGHTGQDEVYLAELLLRKGYEVRGIKRRGLPSYGSVPATGAESATRVVATYQQEYNYWQHGRKGEKSC